MDILWSYFKRKVYKKIKYDIVLVAYENEKENTLKELFLKKYGRKDLSDPKTYEKAFRYFAAKGYGFDDIKKAISSAVEGQEDSFDS